MALELQKLKHNPLSPLNLSLDLLKADAEVDDFASVALHISDGSGDPVGEIMDFRAYARRGGDADCETWPPLNSSNIDPVPPFIDWKRVRGWLSRCCAEHGDCKPARLATPPSAFRVIDVETRQLVRAGPECQFVALSYVWGANPDPSKLQATMSNVERLEERGALKPSEIPAAIDEAMRVCRELGERYLWADRLCIVQDDPVNKKEQIMSMVDIYSSAVLVVALCAGTSMDDSVPGVGRPRPAFKRTVELPGFLIATVLPSFGLAVMPSTWASRGWTYQEAVLPARRLYFTPFQLIYECVAGQVYEDNYLNDSPWRQTDVPCGGGYQYQMPRMKRTYKDDAARFTLYEGHVRNYNSRRLTYTSDIYDAFAGAMSALYGKGPATAHGLPLRNFDEALLWYPHVEAHQPPPTYRLCEDIRLPSWSWVSVSNEVSHFDITWRFKGSIVRWARVCDAGAGRAFEPILESDYSSRDAWGVELHPGARRKWVYLPPQLYLALAASEGCIEAADAPEPGFYRSTSFSDAAARAVRRWPEYRDFRHKVFGNKPSWIDFPSTTPIDGPAIATRAQLTSLTLGRHVHERPFGPCYGEGTWLEIRGPDGTCIGMLAPSPSLSGWTPPPPDSEFDFIGISASSLEKSSLGSSLGCLYAPRDYGFDTCGSAKVEEQLRKVRHLGATYWDADGEPLNPIPTVDVMLIERKRGVARRLSIGWILLTKWALLERRYESIILV
ncbi:hypothetical protein VUR80DRAFT_7333 [Thermomyces stellatus]